MAREKPPETEVSRGEERRRHTRLPVEGISGGFLFSTNAKILNLSLDGVALQTTDYLQVGRSYSLKLRDGDRMLTLRGHVAWCRLVGTSRSEQGDTAPLYKAGVQFEDLLKGTAREVQRFLGSNAVVSVEKRLFGRFQLHRSQDADLDCQATFRVAKISLNGMQIESDTHVEPEAVLDIELRLGKRAVRASGRVVHSTRLDPRPEAESASCLGIEFVDMDRQADRAIRGLIKKAIR